MKKIILIILVIAIIVLGVFVWRWFFSVKDFENDHFGFRLSIPKNWHAVTMNDLGDYFNSFFMSEKDWLNLKDDKAFQKNPLLMTLNKNIATVSVSAISGGPDFAEDKDFVKYLTEPLSGPGGSGIVKVELSKFSFKQTKNNKIYFYTQTLKVSGNPQRMGAIWIDSGVLYTLQTDIPSNLVSEKELEKIALSFEIK